MCKFFNVYGVRFNEAQALHQQQLTVELQPHNLVRRSGLQRITKCFSTSLDVGLFLGMGSNSHEGNDKFCEFLPLGIPEMELMGREKGMQR